MIEIDAAPSVSPLPVDLLSEQDQPQAHPKPTDEQSPSISDAGADQEITSSASSTFDQIDGNLPSPGTAEHSPSISDANQEMTSADFLDDMEVMSWDGLDDQVMSSSDASTSSTFDHIDDNSPSPGTAEPSPLISDANQEMTSADFLDDMEVMPSAILFANMDNFWDTDMPSRKKQRFN